MQLRHLALQALAVVAGATIASAGTLIVGKYTGTKSPQARTVEFRIQDGLARISSAPGQFIYYDHPKRTAHIVDAQKGTSLEMDEAQAKRMGAQLSEAQRMMEQKMKELPPDKRAIVEQMMKEQGSGLPPPGGRKPLTFAKSGSDKVGNWSCDRYSASGDGRTVEVCAAEAATLGITVEDVAVFEGFLDLSEKMAGDAAAGSGIGIGREQGFSGLPLERTESRGGKVTDRFVIETIKEEAIAASDVKVPAGLKAVTPPPSR
jgi:hypothetical protein